MRALLLLFSLRHVGAHKGRAALGVVAIALGVALMVATIITMGSAKSSLRDNAKILAGAAEWRVTRGRSLGVEESLVERIRTIPRAIAAPILEASVPVERPRAGSLLLLGVDLLNDSLLRLYRLQGHVDLKAVGDTVFSGNGILVTTSFARAHAIAVGAELMVDTRLGLRPLRVTGILEDAGPMKALGGNVAVMDIHAAQALFGHPGMVSRIEVAGARQDQLQRICPECAVTPAGRSSSMIEEALSRLDSLVALSFIALLVGLFIIYNSVQISVIERLKEIGTLRALGATRRQILGTLLLEWFFLGVAGSVLGVGLGYALARALLGLTARVINFLVPVIDLNSVKLPLSTALLGLGLGVATAVLAAVIPALGAVRVAPLALLRPSGFRLTHHHRLAFVVGLSAILAGIGAVVIISRSPLLGLTATGLLFLGVALVLPECVMVFARITRNVLTRLLRLEGHLAADNLIKFPQRTALTAVTLGGALSMMVATAAVVLGFQTVTIHWLDEALPFDFTISPSDFSSSLYGEQTMPASLLEEIRKMPGVGIVYGVRSVFSEFRNVDVMVLAVQTEPFLATHRKRGMTAWASRLTAPGILREFEAGRGVFVSDNFAALYGVRRGDTIRFPTPSGPRSFRVLETIEEYRWPRGLIAMDMRAMASLWKDDSFTYIDVTAAPGVSPSALQHDLAERLKGRFSLFLYSMEQIRTVTQDVLQQSVTVANVQAAIAVIIGFLGIVNSLLIGVLQRTREIGLLRAVGMTRRQVATTVVLEGVFVAGIGGVIGLAGGLIGAWFPLRRFTFTVTGMVYPQVVPWPHLAATLLAALGVGLIASLLPARRAAALPILDSIGYE